MFLFFTKKNNKLILAAKEKDLHMKLYYSPGACSLAPHIILEDIAKPYEIELVSTMDGSTQKAEYLEINPKGRVPLLNDGEHIITEASAIMMYLAATNPELNLIDNAPLPLARTIEWMNWLATIHAQVIAQNWRAERFTDEEIAHKGIQKKGREYLIEICGQINNKIANTSWAVGDKYSIADPYLLVFYRWGNRLGLNMREYEHWTQHAEKMEKRNAVKSVLAVEGISLWE